MGRHVLTDWHPEQPEFWTAKGRAIATRNLWISVPNLLLAFSVWMVWSIVVAKLKGVGFAFSTDQLFWLAALPALSGATLRIFYSFAVPIFGGRLWTTLSTLSLLIPSIGIGLAVQSPETPYTVFVVLALLCGLGGGNFASSMANIAFFFPKAEKGNALAINAGIGNLGVSVMQFLVPLVIVTDLALPLLGTSQLMNGPKGEQTLWLQNAGYVWVPFILTAAAAAWLGMNDIASARASFTEQAIVFRRSHTWIMCFLYIGTFGSFIGFSAAFPLLSNTLFPDVNALQFAFLGPLTGALSRALTGWVSDRWGGNRVTQIVFLAMSAGVVGVLYSTGAIGSAPDFTLFFGAFLWMFFWTGVGNASTFQMIPAIVRADMPRLMPDADAETRRKAADMESAAVIGFSSAIGAYGGVFIPMAFGASQKAYGTPFVALSAFLIFYVLCILVNWLVYVRRGAILNPSSSSSNAAD